MTKKQSLDAQQKAPNLKTNGDLLFSGAGGDEEVGR